MAARQGSKCHPCWCVTCLHGWRAGAVWRVSGRLSQLSFQDIPTHDRRGSQTRRDLYGASAFGVLRLVARLVSCGVLSHLTRITHWSLFWSLASTE